jgi:hypothetical protein
LFPSNHNNLPLSFCYITRIEEWYFLPTLSLIPFFDTHPQSYGGYQSGHGGGYSGWGGGGGGYEDRMSNLGGGLKNVDWSSTKLEHFEKNFYIEDKRVSARTEREIEEFKRSKEIKVRADYMDHLSLRSHLCSIFTLGSRP